MYLAFTGLYNYLPGEIYCNTANSPPCLPSVTNAPTRQVPYSSFLNNNKPHNTLLTYLRLLCDFCIVWVFKCLCGYCFSKPRDFLSPFNCDFCIVWKPKCLCCFKATRRFRLLLTVNRCVSKQWIFNSSRRVVVAQNMSSMFKLEWRPTASLPGCVAGEQNV